MSDMKKASGLAVAVLVVATGCSESSSTGEAPKGASSSVPRSASATPPLENPPCEPLPDVPRGRIAYTQTRGDGTTAIYLMKPDGTDRRCLVDTTGPDSFPTWSPDGKSLAFVGGTADQADIYTVRADGTRLRQLTDTKAYVEEGPEWSPDGRRIAYHSGKGDQPPFTVRVMASDGSHDVALISSGPSRDYVDLKSWAPDGRLLFGVDLGGGISLWSMNADGSDRRLLHSGTGDFGAGAVFSPDGKSVIFQADFNGGCIYRSDPAFKHLVRLTQGCVEGFDLSWSPDGEWIIWAGGAHGPADAEVMASDGSQRHTIVDDASVAYTDWQPRPHG